MFGRWYMLDDAERARESCTLKRLLHSNNIDHFSDLDIDRWIVAHMSAETALKAIENCLIWRKKYSIDSLLSLNPIPEVISEQQLSGKCVLMPETVTDPCGRPIMICRPVKHSRDIDLTDMIHFMTYCLEFICRIADQNGARDVCAIVDLENFGMRHMDYHVVKRGIGLMRQYYPERLGKLYVLNPPYMFSACWFVIRQWLCARTLNKICFTSNHYSVDSIIATNTFPASFEWIQE